MTTAQEGVQLRLIGLDGFPLVAAGDDLVDLTLQALGRSRLVMAADDIVVFAQKIVSKAEGRRVDLSTVNPSERALEIAAAVEKDPRLVELILSESRRIVRMAKDVLIVEHKLGFIMANAGIDQSNVVGPVGGDYALLLPSDPDASAARLRDEFQRRTGVAPGVVINDSFGRPWRIGTVGVAIGAAGIASVLDLRGLPDLAGRTLRVTVVGHADELASAASLVMGQAAEARPVVLVRGMRTPGPALPAASVVRGGADDLFR